MGNLNKILIAIVIAGVLISGAIIYVKVGKCPQCPSEKFLSSQEAAEKAITYINQNLLPEGMTASLLNVAEVNGIYKFRLKIGDREHISYVTKDGNLLFPGEGVNLNEETPVSEEPTGTTAPPETVYSEEKLEALAKCLSEKGVKFYGTYRCGWCIKQKEVFGKAAQYLPYIECVDKETQQITSQCQEAGIQGFPTWEFSGEKKPGFKTAEVLSQLANCPL